MNLIPVLIDPKLILFNFKQVTPIEVLPILLSLTQNTLGFGLTHILKPQSLIYSELWHDNQGLGNRVDQVLNIPEITNSNWALRASAIRLLLVALWNLVYEEGRGKFDLINQIYIQTGQPLGYFQIGVDSQRLFMRLIYGAPSLNSPHEALKHFWPAQTSPSSAAAILFRYGDFLRIHNLGDTGDLEIVVGLLQSAPSEKAPEQLKAIWIEPIHIENIDEKASISPSPDNPYLRPLPNLPVRPAPLRLIGKTVEESEFRKFRKNYIHGMTQQIRDLKTKIQAKDEKIRELRTGGVGNLLKTPSTPALASVTPLPLTTPKPSAATPSLTSISDPEADPESILDLFQQRYTEARHQIQRCEQSIAIMTQLGTDPAEIQKIQQTIDALANREKAWMKKLTQIIELYKK